MDWTNTDANALRDYHSKSRGRLLEFLKDRTPVILGTTVEDVALQAMRKEGFELALREVTSLLQIPDSSDDASLGKVTQM